MQARTPLFTPVLIVGCFIMLLSFAIRASFGVFQIPIAEEFGWLRAEFSLAIAIQNLAWGIGQPIFGAIAERIGDRRAIIIGSIVYAVGRDRFDPLRDWFKALYEVLLGASQGPRFGGFIALYGIEETVALIDRALAGELA